MRQSDGHAGTWGTWSSAGRREWPREEPSLLTPGPVTVGLLDIAGVEAAVCPRPPQPCLS